MNNGLWCARAVLVAGLATGSSCGQALSFESASGWSLDLDTTLTYGAQWRVQDADGKTLRRPAPGMSFTEQFAFLRDPDTVIAQNMDDGNNNFATGLVANRLSALTDLEISHGDFGLLLRGKAFYDRIYAGEHTDMDAVGYLTYNNQPSISRGDYPEPTEDDHGSDLAILDAYAYASFDFGQRVLDLRLGRQVINWGEATFFPGINGMQNRFDAGTASVPGTEVKEILLPIGAVYAQLNLTPSVSLQTYYQYEWKRTKLNGVGSYFSQQDYLGPGARNYYVGVLQLFGLNPLIPRLADEEPPEHGQWGTALHFSRASGTEFGLYYVLAHNHAPSFELNSVSIAGFALPTSYRIRYFDYIRTYGLSVTTLIGDLQVNAELSLRANTPMADAGGTPRRDELLQAQIGFTQVFRPTALWDDLSVVGEIVGVQDRGRNGDELAFDAAAWGYALRADFAYKNVAQGLDVNVPVFVMHTVHGTVREANMSDDAVVLSVGVRGTWLERISAELNYSTYFGGGFDNWLIDRDNIALNVKYSF